MKRILMFCIIIYVASAAMNTEAQTRYTVSTDGQEVSDSRTSLVWKRCPEGMVASFGTCTGTADRSHTHETALQHAAAVATSAGKAWRLPNVKELLSIIEEGQAYPAIDSAAFPGVASFWLCYYWSSTPYVGDSRSAWSVNFGDGEAQKEARDQRLFVRLVRTGP